MVLGAIILLMECKICPHQCGVDRSLQQGVCRAPDKPKVALASLHYYEEPVISGRRGSGTIFFSHCNLACVFCQNYDISQQDNGRVITTQRLAEIALELKAQGAHNINLVSPTPYTEQIIGALTPIKPTLEIPVVWNSNGYELVSVLERLEPLVDVYLPDLKFFDPEVANRYCGAADYFKYASRAIAEMWRQKRRYEFRSVGDTLIIEQGVIIRHLVLPGQVEDSKRVLRWIADNLGTEVYISLMAQYTPVHKAYRYPEIARRLQVQEYTAVREYFLELGFGNGWVQELSSASSDYTPEFNLRGI